MNGAIIFVVVLFLLSCSYISNASEEQLRSPNGRFSRGGDRGYALSKGKDTGRPSSTNDKGITDECDVSKDYVLEVEKTLTKIGLLTNKQFFLLDQEKQFDSYCRKASKLLNDIDSQVYCLEGQRRKVFQNVAKGWRRSVQKKCNSRTWRKEYLKYSECLYKKNVEEKIESCSAKEYSALVYILKNIPEKDQTSIVCCYLPQAYGCIRKQTSDACGRRAGQFVRDALFEQRTVFVENVCRGNFKRYCSPNADALEKFNDIFDSSAPRRYDTIYKPMFKIMNNKFDIDEL